MDEHEEHPAQPITTAQDGAQIFALRHLSRALTTLERGILRLEHLGLYIDAFGLRKLWHQLLTDFVRANGCVEYESAVRNFGGEETRAQHLNLALDEVGMALVMAEATMARWDWVNVVADLRKEIEGLYERFARRIPSFEDPVPI